MTLGCYAWRLGGEAAILRTFLKVSLATLALAACEPAEERREQALAECKVRAMDVYKPKTFWLDQPSVAYLKDCMRAQGFKPFSVPSCDAGRVLAEDAHCFDIK